ncbi:unnamed protein product [Boreogadus saida]
MLVDRFETEGPQYCKLNPNVPILRWWFNVELELKRDFRLSRRAMHGLQRLLRRDQDHGWDNQTPGNVTRDRLAAIVSGNEQDPF